MSVPLDKVFKNIKPESTILFFGSGATIDSNAPTVKDLITSLSTKFEIEDHEYNLREISGIVEQIHGRRALIDELKFHIKKATPAGAIKNLALYDWKAIYTTNYDTVIEQCYETKGIELITYDSNVDFTVHDKNLATKLFKLHGTIDKDFSNGYSSRIVITDDDYDNEYVKQYREFLFQRLSDHLNDSNIVILGYSLADEHIRNIITEVLRLSKNTRDNEIILFMYSKDENRASLFEKKGIKVCFGGIDGFFSELSKNLNIQENLVYKNLDLPVELIPITYFLKEELLKKPNINKMVNGYSASFSDINNNYTFKRDALNIIVNDIKNEENISYTILGPSGVGKTTLARNVMIELGKDSFDCYEHKLDFAFNFNEWFSFAKEHKDEEIKTCLFIDDAHLNIREVMALIEKIYLDNIKNFKIILTSTKDKWSVRTKNPIYFKRNKNYDVNSLSESEIDSLIETVDRHEPIKRAIDSNFEGFSVAERKRRLKEKFNSETFVCLKSIFATERFDDIILREYSNLDTEIQEIYKLVAGLEYCGFRVHRQLIIRLLGIESTAIYVHLQSLIDIVNEYEISSKEGIYGWKGRHPVITRILINYKYNNKNDLIELIEKAIDNISPTYDIEVKSLREICNFETGIPTLGDKTVQNRLFRKIISVVPNERIPRHRLIRNLIDLEDYENCDSEIRVFESDFGKRDATICRYKVKLKVHRGLYSPGLMEEDRVAIINQAVDELRGYLEIHPFNKFLLKEMCSTGLTLGKITGDYLVYDHGMQLMKFAEENIEDPEIASYITEFEKKRAEITQTKLLTENLK